MKRIVSLDVLRGITVAGMILVNNAGGGLSYEPLQHSAWNGLTPCDLVFPFFLFIMGASTYISLRKFGFEPSRKVVVKILRRTLLILCIGWAIGWFDHMCEGDFLPFDHLRLLGVLPRIALCYCVASFVALYVNHKFIPALTVVLLVGYSFILWLGNGYTPDENNLLCIIDRRLFGEAHLYTRSVIDPEGLTSTLSAIAHTLIGFWCGRMLITNSQDRSDAESLTDKTVALFRTGFILMCIGFLLTYALPLNKRIWSPTFVLVTCGLAEMLLATLMTWETGNEKRNIGSGKSFFLVFGSNPLFLYVLSEVLAIVFGATGLKSILYEAILRAVPDPYLASALYAGGFTLLLWAIGLPLYKRKIYIKV